MPLYDYACTQCGRVAEVRHGFDETHDGPCQACGGPLRRVFNAAAVLFKGSGFYSTDSRRPAAASKPGAASKPEKAKDEPAPAAPAAKAESPAKPSESAA